MSEASLRSPVASERTSSLIPYAAFTVLLLSFGLYAVFVAGPAQRVLAQDQLTRTISEETRAACEKFGMKAGTAQFVDCADVLATVRQKQANRDHAAEQGI
jgi:hypothetical protein